MQLMNTKRKKTANIGSLIAGATCTLLNQTAIAQETETSTDDNAWEVDTAVLYYSEKGRVDAIEPVFSATKTFKDDSTLNLKAVIDSLTGASPNGAAPSDQAQTFTRPSGNESYVIAPGETPLDDTFIDTRVALSGQYDFYLNRLTRLSTGAAFSKEYDYSSFGVNATIAKDINNRNTTISAGLALAMDSLEPEGGIPTPFTSMPMVGDDLNRMGDSESKDTVDVLLGLTQIINRKSLMQFTYSNSSSSGYHTDPFKIMSLVDDTTGRPVDYLYENRPDSRVKHSLYWKTKYHRENGHIFDASYRYHWDDWDITTHTLDLRYRVPFKSGHYIEPHIRYYTQSEASFYQHSLIAGEELPSYASSDPRLGNFNGITYGAKYGIPLKNDREFSVRLEMYQQNGNTVGEPIGVQNDYDLFPDLEAIIIQFGYSFRF